MNVISATMGQRIQKRRYTSPIGERIIPKKISKNQVVYPLEISNKLVKPYQLKTCDRINTKNKKTHVR